MSVNLGIVKPHGSPQAIVDCPVLYFTGAFLMNPPGFCEVDWSTARCPCVNGELDHDHHPHLHSAEHCLQGIRVIHQFPYHRRGVWVLTGRHAPHLPQEDDLDFCLRQQVNAARSHGLYEGRWPD